MAGILKRKRSDSEYSFLSSTTLSSPTRSVMSSGSPTSTAAGLVPVYSELRECNALSQLSGRTIKRYRSNRPSEAEVHARTLSLLYNAQHMARQQPTARLEQSTALPSEMVDMDKMGENGLQQHGVDHVAANQPSLHSFWGVSQQLRLETNESVTVARKLSIPDMEEHGLFVTGGTTACNLFMVDSQRIGDDKDA